MECFFIISADGCYGSGKTVAEAAKNCDKAGASLKSECSLRYIKGATSADYDGLYITYHGSDTNDPTVKIESKLIGVGFKIGQLLKIIGE